MLNYRSSAFDICHTLYDIYNWPTIYYKYQKKRQINVNENTPITAITWRSIPLKLG